MRKEKACRLAAPCVLPLAGSADMHRFVVLCRNSGDELQLLDQLFQEVVEQPQQQPLM